MRNGFVLKQEFNKCLFINIISCSIIKPSQLEMVKLFPWRTGVPRGFPKQSLGSPLLWGNQPVLIIRGFGLLIGFGKRYICLLEGSEGFCIM